MRKTAIIISIAVAIIAFTSCVGNKTEKNNPDTIVATGPKISAINDMTEYNLDGAIEVNGTKYDYEFAFQNDPSLPVVTTAEGYRYHDNAVLLLIHCGQQAPMGSTSGLLEATAILVRVPASLAMLLISTVPS